MTDTRVAELEAERDRLYAALQDLLPLVDDFVPVHALPTERFEQYERLVTGGAAS